MWDSVVAATDGNKDDKSGKLIAIGVVEQPSTTSYVPNLTVSMRVSGITIRSS